MNKIIVLLILILISACGTTKNPTRAFYKNYFSPETAEFEVVQVPIVSNSDTLILNELRFYTIRSSMNSIHMLTSMYGNHDKEYRGRYQANLPQLIWENKDIFQNGELYTISACGTETGTEAFASVAVFDSENNDCLMIDYPNRQAFIDFFVSKMYKLAH